MILWFFAIENFCINYGLAWIFYFFERFFTSLKLKIFSIFLENRNINLVSKQNNNNFWKLFNFFYVGSITATNYKCVEKLTSLCTQSVYLYWQLAALDEQMFQYIIRRKLIFEGMAKNWRLRLWKMKVSFNEDLPSLLMRIYLTLGHITDFTWWWSLEYQDYQTAYTLKVGHFQKFLTF